MFRRLNDHVALIIKTSSAGSARDLAKIPHAKNRRFFAIVFPELGEEHGTNRDIDPDPEGIGTTDQFEQTFLRQLLDQNTVFG